ncbi:hypothetical protein [Leisingera sp. JC11]|uniref:hypothetical protein n=1 Tax=Leisingera sp. JC11 TaxID=3042469 RepID=UPI0034552F0E
MKTSQWNVLDAALRQFCSIAIENIGSLMSGFRTTDNGFVASRDFGLNFGRYDSEGSVAVGYNAFTGDYTFSFSSTSDVSSKKSNKHGGLWGPDFDLSRQAKTTIEVTINFDTGVAVETSYGTQVSFESGAFTGVLGIRGTVTSSGLVEEDGTVIGSLETSLEAHWSADVSVPHDPDFSDLGLAGFTSGFTTSGSISLG